MQPGSPTRTHRSRLAGETPSQAPPPTLQARPAVPPGPDGAPAAGAQVRAYTLQSLASDTSLMTPHEEVFSRRGSVKLVLMELEQLRHALAQLRPAAPSASPGAAAAPCQASPPAPAPEAAAAAGGVPASGQSSPRGPDLDPGAAAVAGGAACLPQSAAEKARAADPRARPLKGRPRPARADAQRSQAGRALGDSPRRPSGGGPLHPPAGAATAAGQSTAGGGGGACGVLLVEKRNRPTPASLDWSDSGQWSPAQRPTLEAAALGAGPARRRTASAVGSTDPETWRVRWQGVYATGAADSVRVGAAAARAGPAGRRMPTGRPAPSDGGLARDPGARPAGRPLLAGLGLGSRSLEALLPAPRAVGLHQPPEYMSGPVALPWVAGSRSGPARPPAAQPAPQRKMV